MSDLERFRDHARSRTATFDGSTTSAPCAGRTTEPGKVQHGWCRSDTCRCTCHAPTDTERALWLHLADEIDTYLAARDDEQETLP